MIKALVVPTIRENSIRVFLDAWKPCEIFDKVILVEDNPYRSFDVNVEHHYCWKDIDDDLGDISWIISRKDSAIRSYGFWKAYKMNADVIYTLDDDCLPIDGVDFCGGHLNNLNNTPKWCDSVTGFRTRGKPYKNLGLMTNVMFSMGLWEGVPDLDAINMLAGPNEPLVLPTTRVMSQGQYFPFCGMNFAFKRNAAVLTYFPLMGVNSPFGRFDDIWFGIICKKICDHLNIAITCGEPYIYHSKASDPFNNLVKEAPGIKFNEVFWSVIDDIKISGDSPEKCMKEIGRSLSTLSESYMQRLGVAICAWTDLFSSQ